MLAGPQEAADDEPTATTTTSPTPQQHVDGPDPDPADHPHPTNRPRTRSRARSGSLGGSTAGSALAAAAAAAAAATTITAAKRGHTCASTTEPPRVLATALAYVAFAELGALVGLTGPAVPSLSTQLGGRPETQFGATFSCRGGGYLLGSVLASALSGSKDSSSTNNSPRLSLALLRRWLGARPSLLMALALLLAGVATAGVVATRAWGGFLVLMVVQGLGLGMVDVLGNATLLEAWAGHRAADPLMQVSSHGDIERPTVGPSH